MGRELKRVPLDFDYEIGKLWSGYINPHPIHECKKCNGTGSTKDYEEMNNIWYGSNNQSWLPNPFWNGARYNAAAWNNNLTQDDVDALLIADRLWDFTRRPINDEQKEIVRKKVEDGGNSWLPFNNGYQPTPKEVNDWNLQGFGHDSINASICIKARLEKEGKSATCLNCGGTGEKWLSETAKSNYENWEQYEPPTGEGYQLWNTTTEGHPMTPVFATLQLLCEYLEAENVSLFGSSTATAEKWFSMLDDGFVCHTEGNIIFV